MTPAGTTPATTSAGGDASPGDASPTAAAPPRVPPESLPLALSILLFIAATNILTPLIPQVRDDFGVSITMAGLIVGSYGLARLAVDLPAGFLADRVGYARLSRIAVVLLIASSMLGLVAPSVEVLIASRVGSGIAVGILATVILAALSATATNVNRGRVMSLFHVANNIGIALYPLIGGFVGLLIGWRATFAVTAVLAIVGALILLPLLGRMTLPTRAGGARRDQVDARRVLHGRPRTVAVLVTNYGVVANMIHRHGVRNTILPLYAATVLALGGVSIATAIALMSITGLLVATPGGVLGDRIGRRRVITAGLAAVAAGDLAFILTNDLVTFLLVAALIGLGDFFTSSQTALLSEVVPPEERTRSLSQYRFSADLGALIGPILLAFVMDRANSTAAIVLAAAILASASFLAWVGVPREPRDDDRVPAPAHA